MGVSICFHSASERAFHSASDLAALLMFPFDSPPMPLARPRVRSGTGRPARAQEASPMRTSRRVA
jgi:hypothetical protein